MLHKPFMNKEGYVINVVFLDLHFVRVSSNVAEDLLARETFFCKIGLTW